MITLSLENDIRRDARGGEKLVFAQRNPMADMYPNGVLARWRALVNHPP